MSDLEDEWISDAFEAIKTARVAVNNCGDLLSEIRNGFSDPRELCREGYVQVNNAMIDLDTIESALKTLTKKERA